MAWRFVTTSWSQIVAARGAPSGEARQALEALCRSYWHPLYAFVRRLGYDAQESADITQAYFAELLEKRYLEDFDPEQGRFRVFLKVSVKNFLSKERAKTRAWKRGGRSRIVPLDTARFEGRHLHEPADHFTPEEVYEQRWALTLLDLGLQKLQHEMALEGRAREFDRLKGFLTGEEPRVPYRDVAAELAVTEDAVKKAVQRLRQRFGRLLREEIAQTLARPEEADEEVRHLLAAIAPWSPKGS
jgi:RNA polymerase sigma-70 factor (ECF subfamily)